MSYGSKRTVSAVRRRYGGRRGVVSDTLARLASALADRYAIERES